MAPIFARGKGEMVRSSEAKGELPRMQQVSAVVTLHRFNLQHLRYVDYAKKNPGTLEELLDGTVSFPEETAVGVTVWENYYASRPLPRDLFRGEFDRWWSIEGDNQEPTFEGRRLQEFGIGRNAT